MIQNHLKEKLFDAFYERRISSSWKIWPSRYRWYKNQLHLNRTLQKFREKDIVKILGRAIHRFVACPFMLECGFWPARFSIYSEYRYDSESSEIENN